MKRLLPVFLACFVGSLSYGQDVPQGTDEEQRDEAKIVAACQKAYSANLDKVFNTYLLRVRGSYTEEQAQQLSTCLGDVIEEVDGKWIIRG